jgi:hypothetical protein
MNNTMMTSLPLSRPQDVTLRCPRASNLLSAEEGVRLVITLTKVIGVTRAKSLFDPVEESARIILSRLRDSLKETEFAD